MWEGWTKNLYLLTGGPPGVLAKEFASWFGAAFVILIWGIFIFRYRSSPWPLLALLVAVGVGAHLRYAVDLYRNLYPVSYIKYYVPGVCLYFAALIASWWKNTRGTVVWKGRAYPVRTS